MFEGKTFFGATGIPRRATALVSTRLEDWLPEPLTVATRMVKSLTLRAGILGWFTRRRPEACEKGRKKHAPDAGTLARHPTRRVLRRHRSDAVRYNRAAARSSRRSRRQIASGEGLPRAAGRRIRSNRRV